MDEKKLTPAGKQWLEAYEAGEPDRRQRQRDVFLYGKWAKPTLSERCRDLLRKLRLR